MTSELMHKILSDLFAKAIAQGMHAPFPLDCDYWGDKWADKALAALEIHDDA